MKKIKLLFMAAFFLTNLLIAHTAYGDINSELLNAAFNGDTAGVEQLIEKGADPNAKDTFGDTAPMFAASKGYTEIVKILIDEGADPNAEDKYGWTAMMFAASTDQITVVEFLKQAGARK